MELLESPHGTTAVFPHSAIQEAKMENIILFMTEPRE
jgi:hypothetical protein